MSDEKKNHRQGGGRKSWELIESSNSRPGWTFERDAMQSTRLRTDDAEFGCVFVRHLKTKSPTVDVAYRDGRGRWETVKVQRGRIKEVA